MAHVVGDNFHEVGAWAGREISRRVGRLTSFAKSFGGNLIGGGVFLASSISDGMELHELEQELNEMKNEVNAMPDGPEKAQISQYVADYASSIHEYKVYYGLETAVGAVGVVAGTGATVAAGLAEAELAATLASVSTVAGVFGILIGLGYLIYKEATRDDNDASKSSVSNTKQPPPVSEDTWMQSHLPSSVGVRRGGSRDVHVDTDIYGSRDPKNRSLGLGRHTYATENASRHDHLGHGRSNESVPYKGTKGMPVGNRPVFGFFDPNNAAPGDNETDNHIIHYDADHPMHGYDMSHNAAKSMAPPPHQDVDRFNPLKGTLSATQLTSAARANWMREVYASQTRI